MRMSSNQNEVPPLATRGLTISFSLAGSPLNPSAWSFNGSISLSEVTLVTILGHIAVAIVGKLEHLGSFIARIVKPPGNQLGDADPTEHTQFVILLANFGCSPVDMTAAIAQLTALEWKDENNNTLTANIALLDREFTPAQLLTLLNFRQMLPSCDYLIQETLLMLNRERGTPESPMSALLSELNATDLGDYTGTGSNDDPQIDAWAKGIFNRITTGGPNGSMAGQIAVNFMSTVPVSPSFNFSKQQATVSDSTTTALFTILKDAVTSAAESAAQGLADYLATFRKRPSTDSESDRQTATVVKGIKDSMPATGKTVAQLAVYNALGNKAMVDLTRAQQLRVAYTIANSTRAAVEATGNQIADLWQTNSIPIDEELVAVGARGFTDFLKSVGTTVANGVIQAAPVVLNAVINSANANNALGSTLPSEVVLSCKGFHELDIPTKIVLASRIVNGTPNPEATVVTDKAISDLSDRACNLGAQATLDTFNNTPVPPGFSRDEPPKQLRDKFRLAALAVANLSPTFSNVTDIGATNLVTDGILKHSDSLRQNTLEMGIRSVANMIADHPTAEILYKVHLYRLKKGLEVRPRNFNDFLKTAVPIAADIAKATAPALLSIL